VDTEVTGEITLTSESAVTGLILAHERADHKVVPGADVVGVVDELDVESIVVGGS
jgi:hypothetical protein